MRLLITSCMSLVESVNSNRHLQPTRSKQAQSQTNTSVTTKPCVIRRMLDHRVDHSPSTLLLPLSAAHNSQSSSLAVQALDFLPLSFLPRHPAQPTAFPPPRPLLPAPPPDRGPNLSGRPPNSRESPLSLPRLRARLRFTGHHLPPTHQPTSRNKAPSKTDPFPRESLTPSSPFFLLFNVPAHSPPPLHRSLSSPPRSSTHLSRRAAPRPARASREAVLPVAVSGPFRPCLISDMRVLVRVGRCGVASTVRMARGWGHGRGVEVGKAGRGMRWREGGEGMRGERRG